MAGVIQVYDGDGTSVLAGPKLKEFARAVRAELPVLSCAQTQSQELLLAADDRLRSDIAMACFHLGSAFTLLGHEDVAQINEGYYLALEGVATLSNKSHSIVVRTGANAVLNLLGMMAKELP